MRSAAACGRPPRGSPARPGDTLRLKEGAPYTVAVEVPAAPLYAGSRVSLVWNGEPIDARASATGSVVWERFAGTPGYVRVHVLRADGSPVAVTNPVFVEVSR